jgi:TolB-like protein
MANSRSWVAAATAITGTRPVLVSHPPPLPSPSGPSNNNVRFDAFEVNFQSRELRKHGMRIRLAQKPFQILELLLEQPGNVVTRKALRERLWPDTHVGYEHSLNTAMNTLRELLGDSAQNSRYIETLPRLGYRFVAPVLRPAATLAKQMLVVLPFSNLTGSGAQEVFSDGLHEELTSQLGALDPIRLGVIARSTAVVYKVARKSVAEIASELHADHILEGSIRCSGTALRISAQLIHAGDQAHVWSASFDFSAGDPLAIQSDVSEQITKAIRGRLLVTRQ